MQDKLKRIRKSSSWGPRGGGEFTRLMFSSGTNKPCLYSSVCPVWFPFRIARLLSFCVHAMFGMTLAEELYALDLVLVPS